MSTTKKTFQLYWEHVKKYPGYVASLFTVLPITILVHQFIPPLIAAGILNKLSTGKFTQGQLWQNFGPNLLWYGAATLIGGVILWRIVIVIIWRLEGLVLRDIYQRMFNHYMKLSSNFHANSFSGSLVSQTNKFAGSYVRLADTIVFQIFTMLLAYVFTIVILLPKAPLYVLLLVTFSIFYIVTAVLVTKKTRKLSAAEASAQNKQTGVLADMLSNISAVKSFAADKEENKRFHVVSENVRHATMTLMKAALKREAYFGAVTGVIDTLSLVMAAASVVLWRANIATVFLVLTYTTNIVRRLWDFSQSTLRQLNRALGDAREGTETLSLVPELQDPAKPEKVRIQRGAIEFKNVTFAHAESNDDKPLFKNFSLNVKPGEKIGLVGHSGSGKTSLTKLLLRFTDISSGEILIDEQNITSITQNDLRSHISYVPQEPLLFHRSIAENIAYGQPKATKKEIEYIAKLANVHEFVARLPKGYETTVGERGVKLSGGQRQRIAIARAMLKNAPIIVLDEATSALDSESEHLIQDALWRLLDNRTAIVIAHRLSTIQNMDRIVVMSEGEIIEQGSHKELLAQKGAYYLLWTRQTNGLLPE